MNLYGSQKTPKKRFKRHFREGGGNFNMDWLLDNIKEFVHFLWCDNDIVLM